MKLTYPHIGDAHLIGRVFFREIGVEIVTPPANTVKGLELGSEMSPDEICVPFKLMAANLAAAWELGADTAVMPATMGPCRLGEYGELLKSVLDRRGCAFRWILLDSATAIGKRELLRRLAQVVADSDKRMSQILRALWGTYRIVRKLELLERRAHILAGYESRNGACKRELTACRTQLARADGIKEALRIVRRHLERLERLTLCPKKQPLRLLLTGEIYSMIEPFANHRLEELLMDMGVSFEKRVTLGWWLNRTMAAAFRLNALRARKNPYLPWEIGGYAKDTVAEGASCAKKGCDGVIQVFPTGCMPEIVAKAVFSRMQKDGKLRVLTVIYDEMSGDAGYLTRIEAFVDMLARKKRAETEQARQGKGRSQAGRTRKETEGRQ